MGNGKMKKGLPFWGKVCAGVLCATLVMGVAGDSTLQTKAAGESSIASLEAKAQKIKEENERRQQQIAGLDADINENKEAMELVTAQIEGVNDEIQAFSALITAKQEDITQKLIDITNVEQNITEKELEISEKNVEINELKAQNQRNLVKFGKLARYLYMNNSLTQMPVLNGSDDWYDYLVYPDVAKNISGQNLDFMKALQASIAEQEEMIVELNKDINALEDEKEKLEAQKAQYESEAAALAGEKSELESYANDKKNYLYGLAAKNAALKDKIDGLEEDIADANAEMDEINAQIEELIRKQQQAAKDKENYIDYSGDGLRWPLPTQYHWISTYFGYDAWRGGMHRGIDIGDGGIKGQGILAAQSGTVILVSNTCSHNYGKNYSCGCGGGYGNYIIIDHGGGLSTLYAHCQSINVYQGQQVSKGDTIGAVGTTGWSTGYHLHFEVRENGIAVNPFNYVSYN